MDSKDKKEGISNEITDKLFKAVVSTAKATQFLIPTEYSFYKSSDKNFSKSIKNTNKTLLDICNRCINYVNNTQGQAFTDINDFNDNYNDIIEVMDNLLEKADVCIDEITGKRKTYNTSGIIKTNPLVAQMNIEGDNDYKLLHAQNILRPQLKFEDKIDNSNNPAPLKIKFKPNAKVPLNVIDADADDSNQENFENYHPYKYEIEHIEYPENMFMVREPIMPKDYDQTPFTFVDTKEEFMKMIEKLNKATEIAVDLEHHDYRSFQGFTCLVQISTREEDWIVDALAMRSLMYHLNESFTNPNVVKVFHGAESDIVWLQCDFGVYIVNLFDTYHASHLLNYPKHSLAYLLEFYVNFIADKKYQLADWRIRPLPKEMLKYARDDTHYLLYIYDRMRNELISNGDPTTHNLMKVTLERSERTSLKVYHKDIYNENGSGRYGWANIINRDPKSLNGEQFAVLKAVHKWRDQTAREEDESPRYVMPNHILRRIAEEMPTDSQSVHGCCNPIPPLVRMYSMDIARIIEKTRNEFQKNKKEHEKRYEETAKRLKAMKEREEQGPIHKFFHDEEEGEKENNIEGDIMEVDDDEDNEANKRKKIPITIAEKSTFLIPSDDDEDDENESLENKKAYNLMLSIRKSLKLVSPSVTLLKLTESKEKQNQNQSQNKNKTINSRPVKKEEEEEEKDKKDGREGESKEDDKEIFTISESGKVKRKAESIEDLQKPAETHGGSKKKHKKNKRSKKRSSSAAATTPESTATSGKEEEEDGKEKEERAFTPYDYDNNKSDVIEMIKAEANTKTVLETNKDKLKKLKNKKNKDNKNFKPFNALPNEVKFSEKIQKNAVNPRSGNRSYTFKNNKK
jgi:exosome complex exonuclease RRP6